MVARLMRLVNIGIHVHTNWHGLLLQLSFYENISQLLLLQLSFYENISQLHVSINSLGDSPSRIPHFEGTTHLIIPG